VTTGRSGGASRIGGAFLRAAAGPLQFAASCITGNKILKGLEELDPTGLREAYDRGVGDVASLVGVPKTEVLRVLPSAEVDAICERLRFSHARALEAWRHHAGEFGFFDAVTALTVDGRPVEIGEALARIAGKVRADKPLSEPLDALAVDVTAWHDLVLRSRHVLEDRGWLAAAYRRRMILRVALFAIPLVALVAFTVAVVTVRLRRDAVDALLLADDACAAETIPPEKLEWASEDQTHVIGTKKRACEERRKEERRTQEEEERKLAKEREARALREAREGACAALAEEVEKGALTDATKATRDGSDELLGRIAKKTLEPADLGPTDPKLPCGDTAAKTRLEAAYAAALLGDVSVWTQRSDPGTYARAALVAKKADIPANAVIGLADNAERTAKSGLTGGDPNTIARAKRLCALAKDLGTPGRGGCNAVEAL
jgi:hypothetical protein